MSDELLAALATIEAKRPRVLVWGDGCIDIYRFCEQPRPSNFGDAVRCIQTRGERFDGMAAGVAKMAEAMGAIVDWIAPGQVTHVRTIIDGVPALWVEVEHSFGDNAWCGPDDVLESLAEKPQVLLISDYGRGACTPAGIRQVIDAATAAGVPVVVDPHRQRDWSRYKGATVIKCNASEHDAADDDDHWDDVPCVVTNGEHGLWISQHCQSRHFPAMQVECVDTCGAGDCVLAVLGCCMAAGIPLDTACRLSNIAAGIKCQHYGPRPTTLAEIRESLAVHSA